MRLSEKFPAEYNGFLPGKLNIHSGDTLHFTSDGFHTVTMLPAGAKPDPWLADNAASGTSDYYTLTQSDPDEGDDMYKVGTAALMPSRFDCGGAGQPACQFSGSGMSFGWRGDGVLNSGAPLAGPIDFSTTVTAPAGATVYALCLIHPATMRLPITVVDDSEKATDPASAEKIAAQTVAKSTKTAAALHRSYSTKHIRRKAPGGGFVWEAWAGIDRGPIALLALYPARLNVRLGDSIRWRFAGLLSETHTVAGPLEEALELANSLPEIRCDLDTDSGTSPDVEALPPPVFCPGSLYQLEIDWPEGLVPARGDGVFENDPESSGTRGSDTGIRDDYTLSFPRPTGQEGATFICLIHPFMRTTVVAS